MNKYEEIISSCSGLVYMIINNYFRGYSVEDLYQVGVIGLIKAYDKYKENKSTKFSTYAYKWIYGEIYAYVNGNRILKINNDYARLYRMIIEARSILCQRLMREATVNEISVYLGVDRIEICNVLNAMQEVDSLDREVSDDGKTIYLGDIIGSNENSYDEDYMYLEEEISSLPEDEQRLIRMRYYEDMTQSEVSKVLGIHQVEVSRREKKVLKRIRTNYQNVA